MNCSVEIFGPVGYILNRISEVVIKTIQEQPQSIQDDLGRFSANMNASDFQTGAKEAHL